VNRAAAGQRQLAWAVVIIMPRYDVTARHNYCQLMITSHISSWWPAAAWFTEHGQHARHCPMLPTAHCLETTATVDDLIGELPVEKRHLSKLIIICRI